MTNKIYNFRTNSVEETEKLGENIARALDGHDRAFIAMRGEMGVGKTAFTRGFASYFGVKNVKSPTYALLNEYKGRVPIYHFDMYRISSVDDLISVGYDEYCERAGYLICEWSENIVDDIPPEHITIEIKRDTGADYSRIITIETVGDAFRDLDFGRTEN